MNENYYQTKLLQILDDNLYGPWFSQYDFRRYFNFKKKNGKIQNDYLYIDGILCCAVSLVLRKINENSNIRVLRIDDNKFFKSSINNLNILNYNDELHRESICYKTPISNLFHELILLICSRIKDKAYPKNKRKAVTNLFVNELFKKQYKIFDFIESNKRMDDTNVQKIINAINKNISDDNIKNIPNDNTNKKNTYKNILLYDHNTFHAIFIIPHYSHLPSIFKKFKKNLNYDNIYNNFYIEIQSFFFLCLKRFKFNNIHYINIPEEIAMYSKEYLNFVTTKIINKYTYHFMCYYKYIDSEKNINDYNLNVF